MRTFKYEGTVTQSVTVEIDAKTREEADARVEQGDFDRLVEEQKPDYKSFAWNGGDAEEQE